MSEEDRKKYTPLATITPTGHTLVTATFTQAIANAKTAADAAYQQHLGNLGGGAIGFLGICEVGFLLEISLLGRLRLLYVVTI